MQGWGAGRISTGRKELFWSVMYIYDGGLVFKKKKTRRNIALPSQKRQGEQSTEVQGSLAERGGAREGESRIGGLCGFVKGFKMHCSRR